MFVRILRAILAPPRRRLPSKVIPNERRRRPNAGGKGPWEVKPKPFDPTTAKSQIEKKTIAGRAQVIDGDTIRINDVQIRLFGIDAPELNHPYGGIAKRFLSGLCAGHGVRAEILEKDNHGRTVAKCWLEDGRDLSEEMVNEGLAIDWPKYSGGHYQQFETDDARKKLWLADARQKGRMYLWYRYEVENGRKTDTKNSPSRECAARPEPRSTTGPQCPVCSSKMKKKSNRKTGAAFWGCSEFPKCKGSLSVR